jgi:hypothetical protein
MNPAAILPPLDPARVREIATFLEGRTIRLVATRKNRAVWENLIAKEPATANRILTLAQEFQGQPTPVLTDRQYLEERQTDGGNGYGKRAENRRLRVTLFTLAEALENKGRFLPSLNREITAICLERLWVSPRHDWNRLNFEGTRLDVDLISAMTAWTLATADAMLEEGLDAVVRQSIRARIRQTVTGPYAGAIRGLREQEWWTRNAFNWNSVVHSGIVGAALLLDDEYSVDEQAELIAATEQGLAYYLNGFPADGYSPEGMGYWRYGFGHYVLLAEAVLAATCGRLSLYGSEHARFVARFPERFELSARTHFYPTFSDSRFPEPPARWLSSILDRRYGFDRLPPQIPLPEGDFALGFFSTFLHAWGVILSFDPRLVPPWTGSGAAVTSSPLRDWFEESQILVSRLPEDEKGLHVALKGGNNGVSHCHHDLGSFMVTVDDVPVIVDPGLTDYGPGAFGPDRFKHQIVGSYGHPVPLVAGQWQGAGADYFAVVTERKFTDAADQITLDLTKAYAVSSLQFLHRFFDYDRRQRGALTVIDRVGFDSLQAFGTALVTYGEFREESAGIWMVTNDGASVRVEIETGGLPFAVKNEILRDESRIGKVCRLGIDLLSPADRVEIRMRIVPGLFQSK